MRVLVVEDELFLAEALQAGLRREAIAADIALDGDDALAQAEVNDYDVVVLDRDIPGTHGDEVCAILSRDRPDVRILMLTAATRLADKVGGFELGADDYLTKPFDTMELLARLEALLRRAPANSGVALERYQFGDVTVDVRKAEVAKGADLLELSAKEFQLLRYFIENRGTTLSREKLLQDVWGYTAMPSTRTVDVHVAWLRQKLEPNPKMPQYILTVHGLGYKFAG